MAWFLLALAILLEVAGTVSMKLSEGFTRSLPSTLVPLFYLASLGCLTVVMRSIEMSTVYAIWSGAGTALVAAVGLLWFKEPMTALKALFLLMIIGGVAGLQATAK